jgi:FkbM family methyltransferase
MTTHQYEVWVDNLFQTIFRIRDGAAIDVGANVGQTLIKVLGIERDRQYIGFEPQVSCCFFIDQFITQNRLGNHVILPIGLSDNRDYVKLGLSYSGDVRASIIEKYRPSGFYSTYKYVPVVPGDEVLPVFELDSIALLKIDVEGGELEVIRGLSSTINEYKPYIIFEVLPNYLVSTQTELDQRTIVFRDERHSETDRELRSRGYVIYQIQPKNGILKVDVIKASAHQIYNYLAVPEEEVTRFENAYSDPLIS